MRSTITHTFWNLGASAARLPLFSGLLTLAVLANRPQSITITISIPPACEAGRDLARAHQLRNHPCYNVSTLGCNGSGRFRTLSTKRATSASGRLPASTSYRSAGLCLPRNTSTTSAGAHRVWTAEQYASLIVFSKAIAKVHCGEKDKAVAGPRRGGGGRCQHALCCPVW